MIPKVATQESNKAVPCGQDDDNTPVMIKDLIMTIKQSREKQGGGEGGNSII